MVFLTPGSSFFRRLPRALAGGALLCAGLGGPGWASPGKQAPEASSASSPLAAGEGLAPTARRAYAELLKL